MRDTAATAFIDVTSYPREWLQVSDDGVRIAVTYRQVWNDGFGARGWKLDASIGDPQIIASTRATGERIPTSVFIHDILDHFLSGFGISGHRSEAMALIQLQRRTGSDPRSDYEQMVREDLLFGRVNGERLMDFLPPQLRARLPSASALGERQLIAHLKGTLGEARLVGVLVEHFFSLGLAGQAHARHSWVRLGLAWEKAAALGLALQSILECVDREAQHSAIEALRGHFLIAADHCVFKAATDGLIQSEYRAGYGSGGPAVE